MIFHNLPVILYFRRLIHIVTRLFKRKTKMVNVEEKQHVCPVWVGYFLASPLRKLFQSPRTIIGNYIEKGMTVIDAGCAMGFFSLPMARMTGENGKVICIDMQEKMLQKLMKRAKRAGLYNIIIPHKAEPSSLNITDIQNVAGFALAFAVVHEVPNKDVFFSELYKVLKPGGKLLVAEPRGHVSDQAFTLTMKIAQDKEF